MLRRMWTRIFSVELSSTSYMFILWFCGNRSNILYLITLTLDLY